MSETIDSGTPFLRRYGRRVASGVIAIAILAGAIWFLVRAFGSITLADVESAIASQPVSAVLFSLLLTAISFAALASYDVFAARVIAPGRVPAGIAALAGAASNAISSMLGFHAVTSTAVRLRLYRTAGLGLADIARIMALATGALALGFATVLALAFILAPGPDMPLLKRAIGIALLAALAGFLAWLSVSPRRFAIGRVTAELPSARLGFVQMLIGAAEMAASIAALYVLLPADILPSFGVFCAGVIGSVLLGIFSQTPGGIGVFEAAMTALLGGAGRADILAALLLYRLIYNILPFVLSVAAIALFELMRRPRACTHNAC